MNQEIDEYLKKIGSISLDKLNDYFIYKELICYENRNLNGCVKDILRVFTDMVENDKRYIKMFNNSILISNNGFIDDGVLKVRIGVFNKLDKVINTIDSLINFCNKKRIKLNGKLECYDNIGYLLLEIKDINDCLKVVDFINLKLNDNIYSVNPLFFSIGNVVIDFNLEYSYIEILAKYLYRFIVEMKKLNKEINYNNFKDFMLNNYLAIDEEIDIYKYLEFNSSGVKLSNFFTNLNICTSLILYLFNGSDINRFKVYYSNLNRKNSKILNKYSIYDNVSECDELFSELVKCMFLNYGENYTRENIFKYRNTGMGDYITRKNNLRRRIMSSKIFIIFLLNIDLEKKIDEELIILKFEQKRKILENICKEVFLTYVDRDDKSLSKIQVARSLIRMSYGDYATITRNNDARKNAIDNIKPNEVIGLIKGSLGIDYVKREEELYQLYADYIENLCIS